MECEVCTKEIMAGKRCIDCFMSKKKKRPEVTEYPPSTVSPLSEPPLEIGETYTDPYSLGIFTGTSGTANNATASPPGYQSHTLTATDTVENGQHVRRYKVNYPSIDYGETQEGEKL